MFKLAPVNVTRGCAKKRKIGQLIRRVTAIKRFSDASIVLGLIVISITIVYRQQLVSAQPQRQYTGVRGRRQGHQLRALGQRQESEPLILHNNSTASFINDNVDSGKNTSLISITQSKMHQNVSAQMHPIPSGYEREEDTAMSQERELAGVVYDAIVIGAGWAGLGAARTLQSGGITSFLVLEASNVVGGRCRTVPISSNEPSVTVELGCQWIHGASTSNPVFNIAKSSGIPTLKSVGNIGIWSNAFGGNTPHRVSNTEIQKLQQTHYRDGFFPYQRRLQDSTNKDQSLRQTANTYINNKNLNGDTRLGFEYILDSRIVQEYAASLEDMSMWWWDSDSVISGPDHVIQQGAGKGYAGVLDFYASPVSSKIKLDSAVSNINWSNSIALVTYKTGNGSTFTVQAKNVIVTVPLGVLKKGLIQFNPSLPTWKINSIKKLGMGTYEKVILQWKDNEVLPWPSDIEWVEKIASLGNQGQWTEFFNMKATTGKNILVAFAAGREAVRVGGLTDAAIKTEVMVSLRSMFGSAAVPDPVNVITTRWNSNNRSYGSYSYYKLGSKPQHRKWLAETLGGRLYFAGEACHLKYPSTTHGALLSGQTAGKNIVNKLSRRKKRQKK